jgi:Zn-dependent M28 family amino/carboxypeptidase
VRTDTLSETRQTQNIIAHSRGGDLNNTMVVGAHLDSVLAAPGINDNGSGSAAILETAMKMGRFYPDPKNKVIFALWGAEELGLIGSYYWLENLAPEQLAQIRLYLNFDMIGSPNYVRFVYDGDGSEGGNPGPAGSELIEAFFVDYFADKGMATDPTKLAGNSDYAPFMAAGIPVGGLFTGAGGLKTEEQAAQYGGVAGEPYDPNYHTEKDSIDNINLEVENQMLKAMAEAIQTYSEQSLPTAPLMTRTLKMEPMLEFDYLGPYLQR